MQVAEAHATTSFYTLIECQFIVLESKTNPPYYSGEHQVSIPLLHRCPQHPCCPDGPYAPVPCPLNTPNACNSPLTVMTPRQHERCSQIDIEAINFTVSRSIREATRFHP